MEALNLEHLLTRFSDHWSQRTIGTLNDYEIKLAKLLGEFVWHSHPDTDELFLVIYGTLNIQLRDRDVVLKPGEVYVVPRGVEHVSTRTLPWPPLPSIVFPTTYSLPYSVPLNEARRMRWRLFTVVTISAVVE